VPPKYERCLRKVKKNSPNVNPYAVCSASTGIKRKRGGGWTKGKKTKSRRKK
jgi:hypothetical protein